MITYEVITKNEFQFLKKELHVTTFLELDKEKRNLSF